MDLSSLSTIDYVNLTAHYFHLLNGHKEDDLEGRGYSAEQIKAVKDRLNKTSVATEINGMRFTRPLSTYKYNLLGYVLTLFENYERGNLPFPGSVTEQPAQIMEIFSVLQMVKTDYQTRQHKKYEKNVRLNQNKPRTRR